MKGRIIGAALVIGMLVLASCTGNNANSPRMANEGDEVTVQIDDGGWVPCGTTTEAYHEMIKWGEKNDREEVRRVILETGSAVLNVGDRVKVLERRVLLTKVRKLSTGIECWTAPNILRKGPDVGESAGGGKIEPASTSTTATVPHYTFPTERATITPQPSPDANAMQQLRTAKDAARAKAREALRKFAGAGSEIQLDDDELDALARQAAAAKTDKEREEIAWRVLRKRGWVRIRARYYSPSDMAANKEACKRAALAGALDMIPQEFKDVCSYLKNTAKK